MLAVFFRLRLNTREFEMTRRRRQRERQKSNRLNRQNNNSAGAAHSFCTLLCGHGTTTMCNCLALRFMEHVNKRQKKFPSLSKLAYNC